MKPIKTLICSCCGNPTKGRQWYNRDNGFGICQLCAELISDDETEEEMKECYGEKGVHYCV